MQHSINIACDLEEALIYDCKLYLITSCEEALLV